METQEAVLALAALAQSTRLEAFRALVRHEPDGLAAGDLARLLEVPQNTLSAHLSILTRARLVTSERRSRSIVYRANLTEFRDGAAFPLPHCRGRRAGGRSFVYPANLTESRGAAVFLLRDCCGGRREVCEPVVETLQACCKPRRKE